VFGVDGGVIRVRRVVYATVHEDGVITPWVVNGEGLPVHADAIPSFINVNDGSLGEQDGETATVRYLEMLDASYIN
jgi:hypothetical protein